MSYVSSKFNFTSPRWSVFSRVIAAIFAGYALATASALFIEQLLTPLSGKYQGLHTGLLLSFLVYSGAVIWVFSVDSAKRAWLGLFTANIILIVLTWILLQINNL